MNTQHDQFQDYPIVVEHLITSYDGRRILDDINLRVRRGEALVVVGGSGCGKTTLLRHLIGLLDPEAGHIYIKGKDITHLDEDDLNEIRKQVGMLFQSAALFNSMTLGDNVALPLREHTRLANSTIKIMTRIKLGLVGLTGFDNFKPSQLSGGMKKRAGLARALAMDPEILFFDEPSSGLDPIIAAEIDQLIIKLKRAFHMTMVIVTHEMESAFSIADRILMLDDGRVIAHGTPDELRDNPNPRVQQFLNREPNEEEQDEDKYLQLITGDDVL
ncbi:ATP-binding cassette domain-containing protein [candidate division KSB3 bacterium]|uniref:ATP-binding cassette domain-containing protein n=1 Tax=candidate division KSB3 bacterium TaxID=2044937 RepID=A0A9D5JZ96_9BACT|nr:ATP-binding cassette domain-containing protein [candidate division KSB3 bacterium]MBD3326905.1 ATP-binding cassette domain-containing protein [candidate division KSB3 bacterium]